MALHKTKLKSAVSKFTPDFMTGGDDVLREALSSTDYTPEEQEEIIEAIKNQGPGSGDGTDSPKEESLEEKLARLEKENAELKSQKTAAPGLFKKIERNAHPEIKGQKTYDMYKVQKELVPNPENPELTIWTGNFIKIGAPKRTNVRVTEYRAKLFNDHSHNSGERLYPVQQ